jgi:lipoyl-dependent peroxiredoxin subunit D
MEQLDLLREALPELARDIKLNLSSVLQPGALTDAQRFAVAIASAHAARNPTLASALTQDARTAGVTEGVIEDAVAAAVLMAMNNVYYRFRHQVGKDVYSQKPARLRMNRLVAVKGTKADFELICLAVSAINGCEACVRAHEKAVLDGGLSEEQVHDAVRVAATVSAAALAVGLGEKASSSL